MPKSVTGTFNVKRAARGFTLLEVLVVILIVGLLAGLAGLAQVDGGQQARREAERLRSLIGLLRADALLNHRDYGLRLDEDRYSVQLRAGDGRWQPALQYREQQLPADIRLQLDVDVNLLNPKAPVSDQGPQLLVLSNDEISPFTLRVEQRLMPVFSLHSDGLEEVRIETL